MYNRKSLSLLAVLGLLAVTGCSTGVGPSSGGRYQYKNPALNVEVQRGEVPVQNRNCNGKRVINVLAGSENRGLEMRGLDNSNSIVEDFNEQSAYCLDLGYAGTTEIGATLQKGGAVINGQPVELYMPAASWALDFGGREKIADQESISTTNVVFTLKPSLIEAIGDNFEAEFGVSLNNIGNLSVEQVNWIVAQDESVSAATSPTHSNSGFSYAVSSASSGAPNGLLTAEVLRDPASTKAMLEFFSEIDYRSSSTGFVTDLLISTPKINALLTYEMLAIEYNTSVEGSRDAQAEPVQIYYLDTQVVDMPLALTTGASDAAVTVFEDFVEFARTAEVQERLLEQGRRIPSLELAAGLTKTSPADFYSDWGVQADPQVSRPQGLQQVLINELLGIYAANIRTKAFQLWGLDHSSSMEGQGEQTVENILTGVMGQTGEEYFVKPKSGDTVLLFGWSDYIQSDLSVQVDGGSSDLQQQVAWFNEQNVPNGGTHGFEAVQWATQVYNEARRENSDLGVPTIYLMTDGSFNGPGNFNSFMDWAFEQSQSDPGFVIPQVIQIAVQTSPNSDMDKLAVATGGRSISVSATTQEELEVQLAERFRYAQGYQSPGFRFDGTNAQ